MDAMDSRGHAVTYAAIDIGSNAVRLLIKQLEDDFQPRFNKVLLLRVPLRLGFDVFSNGGSISDRKRKDLVRLMKSYKQLMKIYDVTDYRACATSAMRDAANGADIIREVRKKTGISIEIIDGQEEARMVYNNHIEAMKSRKGNYMYVDVGGGSTEINLLADGELICSRNINKLYKLVERRDKRYPRMHTSSLQALHDRLKEMSVKERMDEYDLKPDRADVIVPAGEIFLTIADITGAAYIYVPVIGLSDGIIDGLYTKHLAELSR